MNAAAPNSAAASVNLSARDMLREITLSASGARVRKMPRGRRMAVGKGARRRVKACDARAPAAEPSAKRYISGLHCTKYTSP